MKILNLQPKLYGIANQGEKRNWTGTIIYCFSKKFKSQLYNIDIKIICTGFKSFNFLFGMRFKSIFSNIILYGYSAKELLNPPKEIEFRKSESIKMESKFLIIR